MSEEIKKENEQPTEETPETEHTENTDEKKCKKGKKADTVTFTVEEAEKRIGSLYGLFCLNGIEPPDVEEKRRIIYIEA